MAFPTRREVLQRAVGGFGAIALSGMLADESPANEGNSSADPLAPKKPHHVPRAKRVIFLYMTGGVSHVDSFDPKPKLFANHGKEITVDNWQGKLGDFTRYLKTPDWKFKPGGKSGIEVSDLFPHIREVVDDLCVIRSMESEHTNHLSAVHRHHFASAGTRTRNSSDEKNAPIAATMSPPLLFNASCASVSAHPSASIRWMPRKYSYA